MPREERDKRIKRDNDAFFAMPLSEQKRLVADFLTVAAEYRAAPRAPEHFLKQLRAVSPLYDYRLVSAPCPENRPSKADWNPKEWRHLVCDGEKVLYLKRWEIFRWAMLFPLEVTAELFPQGLGADGSQRIASAGGFNYAAPNMGHVKGVLGDNFVARNLDEGVVESEEKARQNAALAEYEKRAEEDDRLDAEYAVEAIWGIPGVNSHIPGKANGYKKTDGGLWVPS